MRGFRFGFGFMMSVEGGYLFLDSDAAAYYNSLATANGGDIDALTTYAIELDILKGAIDTFFVDAKVNGYYSDLVRMYPFIGGTDVTHAVNMVTAASELTYVGSPIHNSTGMVLNGTTQYADMNNSPDADLTAFSSHIMQWGGITTDSPYSMGSRDSAIINLYWRQNLNEGEVRVGIDNLIITDAAPANQWPKAVIVGTRLSQTDLKLYVDTVTILSNVGSVAENLPSTYSTLIGCWDNGGTPVLANSPDGNIKAASIGTGLNTAQVIDFDTDIRTLNTNIGRHYTFSDTDAEAYWGALTDANLGDLDCPSVYRKNNSTIMKAIDDFYIALKVDTTYNKMIRMFLFIGGSDETHAINAVDLGSDLIYSGATGKPYNNAEGVNFNGASTGRCHMQNDMSTDLTNNDFHLATFGNTLNSEVSIGCRQNTTNESYMRNLASIYRSNLGDTVSYATTDEELHKVLIGSRTSITRSDFYIDGVSVANSTATNADTLQATYPCAIGAANIGNNFQGTIAGNIKFASIGGALTGSQAITLTNAVEALNAAIRPVDYFFTDVDAYTYWHALTVANGSEIDAPSLYGVSVPILKGAIENFIITSKSDGLWGGFKRVYPFIGGTAATHAINMVTAVSDLTYIGSPTHDGTGTILNGTTQYIDVNNDFKTEVTGGFDWAISLWLKSTNSTQSMGARDSSAIGSAIRNNTVNTFHAYINNAAFTGIAATDYISYLTVTRTSNILGSGYQGTVLINSTPSVALAASLPTTYSTLIGAWENYGAQLNKSAGNVQYAHIGDKLTSTQVALNNTNVTELNTILGRQ